QGKRPEEAAVCAVRVLAVAAGPPNKGCVRIFCLAAAGYQPIKNTENSREEYHRTASGSKSKADQRELV
ncbi:MAG: hypothetical protein AAF149_25180, partial [Bacteroidota bacterium]